jgi:hypothetical protein
MINETGAGSVLISWSQFASGQFLRGEPLPG